MASIAYICVGLRYALPDGNQHVSLDPPNTSTAIASRINFEDHGEVVKAVREGLSSLIVMATRQALTLVIPLTVIMLTDIADFTTSRYRPCHLDSLLRICQFIHPRRARCAESQTRRGELSGTTRPQ